MNFFKFRYHQQQQQYSQQQQQQYQYRMPQEQHNYTHHHQQQQQIYGLLHLFYSRNQLFFYIFPPFKSAGQQMPIQQHHTQQQQPIHSGVKQEQNQHWPEQAAHSEVTQTRHSKLKIL